MPPSPPLIVTDKEQYNKRNVSREDGGNYSCVMSSPAGRSQSPHTILLAILSPPTTNIRSTLSSSHSHNSVHA